MFSQPASRNNLLSATIIPYQRSNSEYQSTSLCAGPVTVLYSVEGVTWCFVQTGQMCKHDIYLITLINVIITWLNVWGYNYVTSERRSVLEYLLCVHVKLTLPRTCSLASEYFSHLASEESCKPVHLPLGPSIQDQVINACHEVKNTPSFSSIWDTI